MEFIKIHERKLKIALEKGELSRFGLAPADIDYEKVETKRALWQMLEEAKRSCGFDASGRSLYVEVYPSRTGACEIFVSCLDEREKRVLKQPFSVSFDDGEEAIRLSAALLVAGYSGHSLFYRLCGRFYLILFLSQCEADAYLRLLALEFGQEEAGSVYEIVKREGQLLLENAVFRLGDMILHRTVKEKL